MGIVHQNEGRATVTVRERISRLLDFNNIKLCPSPHDVPVGRIFFHMSYDCLWVRCQNSKPSAVVIHVFEDDTSGLMVGMHLEFENMNSVACVLLDADFFAGENCVYRTWNT